MITLINGPKSVNLKYISRSILDSQKTWSFKDYKVNYRDDRFIVVDSDGKNIYCDSEYLGNLNYEFIQVNDQEILKENSSFIQEIDDFNLNLHEQIQKKHFSDSWPTTSTDLFFKTNPINFHEESEYENILNSFRENTIHNFWTGIFSFSFIQKIRKDLGEDNVRILNIIRNPSTCIFVNNFDEKLQFKNGLISILNMVMVKDLPNVINIKYEDYLQNGKFLFDEKEVLIREQLSNYNGIINEYEFTKYDSERISDSFMNQMNRNFCNFDFIKNIRIGLRPNSSDEYELFENFMKTLEDDLNEDVVNKVPKNFFEYLGYSPLSIQQIISK